MAKKRSQRKPSNGQPAPENSGSHPRRRSDYSYAIDGCHGDEPELAITYTDAEPEPEPAAAENSDDWGQAIEYEDGFGEDGPPAAAGSPQGPAWLTRRQIEMMLTVFARRESAFSASRGRLTPASLAEESYRGPATLWSIITDYHAEHHGLPGRDYVADELEARLDQSPDPLPDAEIQRLRDWIARTYDERSEPPPDSVGLGYLRQYLGQRLAIDQQRRMSQVSDLTEMARASREYAERLREIESIGSDEIVTFGQLAAENTQLRTPVIEGLLRRGETCNIIAPAKYGKSWLACGLALSIAVGRPWLARFPTRHGRVLIIDNELHRETLVHRIHAVADAMAIPRSVVGERIEIWSLRGQLINYFEICPKLETRPPGRYQAIIVDAHYRMLPPGISENDNAAMAQVYNRIDQLGERTQAAIPLIHHSTKGGQQDKDVTDVGAGAGTQSRAVDSHLILRAHQEPGHAVLDAAVRSWAPVEPITLAWEFPLWIPTSLDPSQLRGRHTRGELAQQQRDAEGRAIVLNLLRRPGEPISRRGLQEMAGMGPGRINRIIAMLASSGEITIEGTGGSAAVQLGQPQPDPEEREDG